MERWNAGSLKPATWNHASQRHFDNETALKQHLKRCRIHFWQVLNKCWLLLVVFLDCILTENVFPKIHERQLIFINVHELNQLFVIFSQDMSSSIH